MHVDLSPLLMRVDEALAEEEPRTVKGWFPIFDTLRGVRGELHLDIRVSVST